MEEEEGEEGGEDAQIDGSDKVTCKYYTREEVIVHNGADDIWVIVHGQVFDLTPLVQSRLDSFTWCLEYLVRYAGQELSAFFDRTTGLPKMRITQRGNQVPLFPAAFEVSDSAFSRTEDHFWWEDPLYRIGRLTSRPRPIRVVNTLTASIQRLTVCEEDTIEAIQAKFRRFNWNAEQYAWRKYDCIMDEYSDLCRTATLNENGLLDVASPPPALWLFFIDRP